MYGAILGDMIGAPYEFDRGNKTKDFPLFSRGSQFTDDSAWQRRFLGWIKMRVMTWFIMKYRSL